MHTNRATADCRDPPAILPPAPRCGKFGGRKRERSKFFALVLPARCHAHHNCRVQGSAESPTLRPPLRGIRTAETPKIRNVQRACPPDPLACIPKVPPLIVKIRKKPYFPRPARGNSNGGSAISCSSSRPAGMHAKDQLPRVEIYRKPHPPPVAPGNSDG